MAHDGKIPRQHVLALDDDEGILLLQRRTLERAGYKVTGASNLAQAESAISQSAPDLLLLDYSLGTGESGLEFYRHLRSRGLDVPAILVTGFTDQSKAIEALRAGVRDVIPKVGDYLGYLPDAVGRVLAQVGAAKALAEAEIASRAKDRFLAVLSHELRTPLTPVMTAVQMLQSTPGLPREAQGTLELIRRNVELEARLIDDLLDLTRISRGKLRLQISPTNIHDRVANALQTVEDDVRGKRLQLKTHFAATRIITDGDPTRLQQVFWNVVKNAVKFTPEGGTVSVRTVDAGVDRVRVEISDTGIGFEPKALGSIFRAFEQGGSEITHQFGGLGLGLNISRSLVEGHGGTITAASEGAGKGATFVIELAGRPERVVQNDPKIPVQQNSALPQDSARRILLVEDHIDTAAMMARLLRRSGHKVTAADSVASALQIAATEPFDVVISDIGLPDGSGVDLMRQLSARYELKGIALSGFGMEEDLNRSREAGFLEHLVKPINIEQLEQTLLRVTGG